MSKKILSFLFALVVVFSGSSVTHAQIQSCSPINSSNYPLCCPSQLPGQGVACVNFKLNLCAATPTDPLCQNIRGGTPNTNPTNGGGTSPTIAPTPSTTAGSLATCASITFNSLLDVLIWLKCVIASAIIPLVFSLAFLYFLWGMVMFIKGADDVKKREESKKFIYWGIIGLTVMVAVWGIVKVVTSTFGLGNTVPQLQTDCLTTDKNNHCK